MATAASQSPQTPKASQETYAFSLLLSGVAELDEKVESAIFTAGCDDAVLSMCNERALLHFDRTATSLVEAIRSAIADVERNSLAIKVEHVMLPGEEAVALDQRLPRVAPHDAVRHRGHDSRSAVRSALMSNARKIT